MHSDLQRLEASSQVQDQKLLCLWKDVNELAIKMKQLKRGQKSNDRNLMDFKWINSISLLQMLSIHDLLKMRLINQQFNEQIIGFINHFYKQNLETRLLQIKSSYAEQLSMIPQEEFIIKDNGISKIKKYLYRHCSDLDMRKFQHSKNLTDFPLQYPFYIGILLKSQNLEDWQISTKKLINFKKKAEFIDLTKTNIQTRKELLTILQDYLPQVQVLFGLQKKLHKICSFWVQLSLQDYYVPFLNTLSLKDKQQLIETMLGQLNRLETYQPKKQSPSIIKQQSKLKK